MFRALGNLVEWLLDCLGVGYGWCGGCGDLDCMDCILEWHRPEADRGPVSPTGIGGAGIEPVPGTGQYPYLDE